MKKIIYALTDENEQIRYIGKTNDIAERYSGHMREAEMGQRNYRCTWIRSMFKRGLKPAIEFMAEVDGDGSTEEIATIAYFKKLGIKLTNGTLGGDGFSGKHSEESKLKMSKGRKGKPHNAEWNAKVGAANRGRKVSQETREKIKKAMANAHYTPEGKERMREAGRRRLGEKKSDEWKAKIGNGNRGQKRTPEQIQKMRELRTPELRERIASKLRGIPLSAERRMKISKTLMGRPMSPECKMKISQTMLKKRLEVL